MPLLRVGKQEHERARRRRVPRQADLVVLVLGLLLLLLLAAVRALPLQAAKRASAAVGRRLVVLAS